MEPNGTSSFIEMTREAVRRFEKQVKAEEPEVVEIYMMESFVYAVASIAESLDALSKIRFHI